MIGQILTIEGIQRMQPQTSRDIPAAELADSQLFKKMLRKVCPNLKTQNLICEKCQM